MGGEYDIDQKRYPRVPGVIKHGRLENGPFISDFPINTSIIVDFPASHVRLPERIRLYIPFLRNNLPRIFQRGTIITLSPSFL